MDQSCWFCLRWRPPSGKGIFWRTCTWDASPVLFLELSLLGVLIITSSIAIWSNFDRRHDYLDGSGFGILFVVSLVVIWLLCIRLQLVFSFFYATPVCYSVVCESEVLHWCIQEYSAQHAVEPIQRSRCVCIAEGRNGSTPKTLEGGRFPSRTPDYGDKVFVTDVTLWCFIVKWVNLLIQNH